QAESRLVAAATLAAIAVHGLISIRTNGEPAKPTAIADARRARSLYARFLAITAANPLTIASFAAIAASLSLPGFAAGAAFVAGVGIASAGWHLALTLAAGHAGLWITPRIRRGLGIGGRLIVVAIAAHLALGA